MIYTSSNNGSATILTMMIAAVIITVGLGFNWLVKEHLKASEGLRNKAEAILKARSAYDTILYLMLNGKMTAKEIVMAGSKEIPNLDLETLPLNGQRVPLSDDLYVQARDSNGMLSLVSVNTGAMERLIKKVGGMDNASGIIASYLDWIDEDNFVRVNGAEEFYYRGQKLPYDTPRNYAIQYKEELEFIKGIDKALYSKIEPCLTMLPSTGFNPNTASDEALMAYLDINEESLKNLKDYMSKKSVTSDMELFALTGRKIAGEEGIYFFPSPFIEFTVSAGRPRSIYTIKAGLDIRQNIRSPYGVLYWREE